MFKASVVLCRLCCAGLQLLVCFVLGLVASKIYIYIFVFISKLLKLFLAVYWFCTWCCWCATLPSLFTLSSWRSYGVLYSVVVLLYPAMFRPFLSSHSMIWFWLFWGIPSPLLVFNDLIVVFDTYTKTNIYIYSDKHITGCIPWRLLKFID
jgi:hypothetical protein